MNNPDDKTLMLDLTDSYSARLVLVSIAETINRLKRILANNRDLVTAYKIMLEKQIKRLERISIRLGDMLDKMGAF